MDRSIRLRTAAQIALCVSSIVLLSACGGSGGGDADTTGQILSDAPVITSGNSASAPADASTPEFIPSPGAGLDINFEEPEQNLSTNTDFIAAQWEHMQTCLMVSAQEPTVVVVDGKLTPTDSNDDVVRFIDGQIQASSHVTDTSASIQVRAQDFDGSMGKPGSFLRSIMGRYLWLANNLAERDYPYNCAEGS